MKQTITFEYSDGVEYTVTGRYVYEPMTRDYPGCEEFWLDDDSITPELPKDTDIDSFMDYCILTAISDNEAARIESMIARREALNGRR